MAALGVQGLTRHCEGKDFRINVVKTRKMEGRDCPLPYRKEDEADAGSMLGRCRSPEYLSTECYRRRWVNQIGGQTKTDNLADSIGAPQRRVLDLRK